MADTGSSPDFWASKRRVERLPTAREIDVWRFDLAPSEAVQQHLETLLHESEIRRADRFRFARHRRRFIVRRGVMRTLLGEYLSRDPRSLEFVTGAQGKPSLGAGAGRLLFNLSDSADAALLAVVLDDEVGVDIEGHRPVSDLDAIARRFFSDVEKKALQEMSDAQRSDGFFRAWTRKEAYLKAIGTGLHTPLRACTVTVGEHEPAKFLEIEGQPGEQRCWSLYHLDPGAGFMAAVAIRRAGDTLRLFNWSAG